MLSLVRAMRSACLLGFALCAGAVAAADFSDMFTNRQLATGVSLVVTGSNVGATKELYEPRHADKIGGRSVWISWVAPTNGLVSLSTAGSTFDTLLAVYRLKSGSGSPMQRLEETAENDDDDESISTVLEFAVAGGTTYEIAVDGFAGATGDIRMELTLQPLPNLLPAIARRPGDVSLRQGDTLILTVDIDAQQAEALDLHWYFNNVRIYNEEEPTLVIPNFQATNVGQYKIRLEIESGGEEIKFYSAPVEIQINSEGQTNALARNKLEDAADSGLTPGGGGGGLAGSPKAMAKSGGGVARGYNGYQVFDTTFATRDPLEPQHCGLAGGPTYWFSYQPPANGTLHLDTAGSTYDTMIAVYTYNPPLTGYGGLIAVACDNNGGSNGTSSLNFEADSMRSYFIVVDGVNNSRGRARLNWSLTTSNPPPAAPSITRQPRSFVAAAGTTIALDVVAAGVDPKHYQWFRNGTALNGQTNAALILPAIAPNKAGDYSVLVSNLASTVESAHAMIDVMSAPKIAANPQTGHTILAFPATRGFQYRIDATENFQTNGWSPFTNALTDEAGMIWITNSVGSAPAKFFRLIGP